MKGASVGLTTRHRVTLAILPLAAACSPEALAQRLSSSPEPPSQPREVQIGVGVERLWPTHRDRQIQTLSLNALIGRELLKLPRCSLHVGFTATHAHGFILQLNHQLHEVRYDTSAFGLGPVIDGPPAGRMSLLRSLAGGGSEHGDTPWH